MRASRVYTELAVFEVGSGGATVRETFGISYPDRGARVDVPLSRSSPAPE